MRNYTVQEEQKIIRLYTEEHRGQLYCAKTVLGVANVKYVKDILNKYNIPIRNHHEAAILSNKNRESDKDKTYFSRENSNMAWMLGFLASDGYISKKDNEIGIGLARKDHDILEIIRNELKLQTPVKDYVNNLGYDCSKLTWSCAEHKRDLAKYSIVPAKTFILEPPLNLNPKYYIDYIRGYFDGDGSVSILQEHALRWQVCSATKPIIEFVINTLYNQYNIPKVNIQMQVRHNPLYYCQYSTNATKQIYKILYTPNSLYLPRKYKHFTEIINSY